MEWLPVSSGTTKECRLPPSSVWMNRSAHSIRPRREALTGLNMAAQYKQWLEREVGIAPDEQHLQWLATKCDPKGALLRHFCNSQSLLKLFWQLFLSEVWISVGVAFLWSGMLLLVSTPWSFLNVMFCNFGQTVIFIYVKMSLIISSTNVGFYYKWPRSIYKLRAVLRSHMESFSNITWILEFSLSLFLSICVFCLKWSFQICLIFKMHLI